MGISKFVKILKLIFNKIKIFKYRSRGIYIGTNVFLDKNVEMSLSSFLFDIKNGKIKIDCGSKLSNGVILETFGGNIEIGKNVFLGPNTVIYGHGNVKIGDNCLIAMGCKIISANHSIPLKSELIREQPDIKGEINIGNDVWLGADVKVLSGVTIGDGCVVGAGSVVTKNIEPFSISVGVPSRVINHRK
jgi:acetyltransferase-like isoleucine patch superfamily enzyme